MSIGQRTVLTWLVTGAMFAIASPVFAQIQQNDLVLGTSVSDVGNTLQLARGPASLNGGIQVADPWTGFNFQQSVQFDNFGSVRHNKSGNMLSMNFGDFINGASLVNFATDGSATRSALITEGGAGGFSSFFGHVTRAAGLSVSPDNTKIAFAGTDFSVGRIYVMNYNAGATPGAGTGASVTPGPVSAVGTITTGDTTGTTWLDNNTIVTFESTGKLITVDATTGAHSLISNQSLVDSTNHTSLAYEPALSPYLYVMWGSNNAGATTNKLYLFDPVNSFANPNPVATIDFSTSINTAREIAFDSNGNLYVGQFNGSGNTNAAVDVLVGLAGMAPAAITANSSIDWYDTTVTSSFTGLDVAASIIAAPPAHPGDFDGDGDVDGADFVAWQTNFPLASGATLAQGDADGDGDVDGADFVVWQTNFPFTPGPGASPVPEPATWLLMGLTLPALTRLLRKIAA